MRIAHHLQWESIVQKHQELNGGDAARCKSASANGGRKSHSLMGAPAMSRLESVEEGLVDQEGRCRLVLLLPKQAATPTRLSALTSRQLDRGHS